MCGQPSLNTDLMTWGEFLGNRGGEWTLKGIPWAVGVDSLLLHSCAGLVGAS